MTGDHNSTQQDALTWPAERQQSLAEHYRARNAQRAHRTRRERLRLRLLQILAPPRRGPLPSSGSPERVLIMRPDHVGDVLLATPALHQLRQAWPDAHITALVGPWSQAVLRHSPDVDALQTLSFPGFSREARPRPWTPYRMLIQQARTLAALRFDLALILRFDHWWGAWLAALAGIQRRVGYAVAECRPFLTDPIAYVPGQHEVRQNLALVEAATGRSAKAVSGLRFAVPDEATTWARQYLAARAIEPSRLVALAPGAGAAVKLWRPEAWVALANYLHDEGYHVVLTGGPGERTLATGIVQDAGHAPDDLTGQTTLEQLAALFRQSRFVVGLDSGPLHLAAAMDTPTIQLFGPVDAAQFGPWGDPTRHLVLTSLWSCIPCNRLDYAPAETAQHPCVRAISLDQVMAAVRQVSALT